MTRWDGKEKQQAEDSYPLIVTAGVIRKGDAVLIARRQSGQLAGQWEFPGGKLEPGESPEECLVRELREELDLEVEVKDILSVVYHKYPGRPVLLLAYSCRPADDSEHDRTVTGPEQTPSRWVRIADLSRYAFAPADLPIVEKLRQTGPGTCRGGKPPNTPSRGDQGLSFLSTKERFGFRWPDAPVAIRSQVTRFVNAIISVLAENLVGIYLHGSLAMGGFNPRRSDIDLLVVTHTTIEIETKRRLIEILLELSGHPRPIEVSFLSEADLTPWKHPTPFDLHFGESWRERYTGELRNGTWVRWNEEARDDADLAAHITVTRYRGICLSGKPPTEAFPPVPWRDYLESIVADLSWACEQPKLGPDYVVLNACRVLAAVTEGQVLSKTEAAVWALARLPETLLSVVRSALREYRGETKASVTRADIDALVRYVMAIASG